MFASLIAVVALGLYALSQTIGVGSVVAIGLVALLVLAPLPWMGIFIGHRNPRLARWLMWTWTPAVLIVAGSVGALAAYLGLRWVAGQNAELSEKVLIGLVAGVVTALATGFKDWVEKRLAPWLTKALICKGYRPIFPCSPIDLGPGRTAYERLSDMCRASGSDAWSGSAVEELLADFSAAIGAGQYQGGPEWDCP